MTAAGILDGVRVVDFTWVIAGPQCTQVLADFGAEVIRVEWPHHPDAARFRSLADDADQSSPDLSGFWNNLNRNKRSITLNMRHPEGPSIALDLIAKSDVVVENFSPGVLKSWGLPWERMQEANPRLVYLSMSGFGVGGPNEKYVVFGPVMQAVSGLHAMTARPGREPAGLGFSYADYSAGYLGALAILAGLAERDATGQAAMIDLSEVEAAVALTSAALLDYQVNARPFTAWGNVPYGAADAPAGLYPCKGNDSWCAISIRDNDQWDSLVGVMGLDDLGSERRFDTQHGRMAHRGLLDQRLSEWTSGRDRDDVVALLREAGVPATAMSAVDELMEDEALRSFGYFQSAQHPYLGEREFQMGGIRSPRGPDLRGAAPTMGEANQLVYGDILGLSKQQIESYRNDAVI
jgi:crotonobetainyl-CoA:carnitine CoA-transferase CaiB-like acyl-CoA transferase